MQLYNCRVRVGGQIGHEVPRECVSEMEINVLRHIHGQDSVVGFKKHGSVTKDRSEEINYLVGIYGAERVSAALNVQVTAYEPIVESEDDLTFEQVVAQKEPAVATVATVKEEKPPVPAKQKAVDPVMDRMANPQ